MTTDDTVRTMEGDTADLVAWRVTGRTAGTLEAILEANPGLAALGPILPTGTVVRIPAMPESKPVQPVRLWD